MRNYLEEYEGNECAAVLAMAADLMRGDPAEFKQGYSVDNALRAACDYLAPGDTGRLIMQGIGIAATTTFLIGYRQPEGI